MAITKDTIDAQYSKFFGQWRHVRKAIEGKAGVMDLVKTESFYGYGVTAPAYRITDDNTLEVTERKRKYFGRGRYSNFTGRTHDAYLGMIGSAPVEHELPDGINAMSDDVDGENSTLHDFALHLASELLITARAGVLSNPPTTAGATMTMAEASTPTLIAYSAEQIIYSRVDKGRLQEVRLIEMYWREVNETEWEQCEQIRRLVLIDGFYVSQVWRDNELYEEEQPIVNGSALDYIPFQFYGSENNKPTYDRPVMFDLAHQNLGHFALDCDNRDNLHYHGQGMTNVYTNTDRTTIDELNPSGIDVGAKGVNIWGAEDRVEVLQIAATGAIATEMERDEKRMIMLGAQVVQDTASTQTLGAKRIESNASTSQLKRIALNISAGLKQNLIWCAEFVGAGGDVSVNVNTKFITDDLTAQDVQAVFAAVQGGYLPDESLLEVIRKAGYTDKTDEELKDMIDEQSSGTSEEVAALMLRIEQLEGANNGAQ